MPNINWKRRQKRSNYERSRENKTFLQSTRRDFDALFLDLLKRGRGNEIVKQFQDDKALKELEELYKQLIRYRDEIEVIFDELKEIYNVKYFTGSQNEDQDFTTQLFHMLQQIGNTTTNLGDIEHNLVLGLQNTKFDSQLLDTQKYNKMVEFVSHYFNLKNSFLEASSQINAKTEQLRGDKQRYGIFLEAARNKAGGFLDPNFTDKFISLSREQFERFEKENPELFEIQLSERYQNRKGNWTYSEGTARGFGLKAGVTSQQIYEKMIATFGEEAINNASILDNMSLITNSGQSIKYQNLFTALLQSNSTNLTGFNPSRRLEMLFDKNFQSAIQNGESIESAIQQINTSGYHENIAGIATGDVNFQSPNGDMIAFQLKYKNANYLPWNNGGFQGVIDAIDNYLRIGRNITASDILSTDGILNDDYTQNQLLGIIENDSRFWSWAEEVGTEFLYQDMSSEFIDGIVRLQ